MIPPDAGIRMRMQTETALQPVAPLLEIPSDLPELVPGQTFTARIQEVMPENTYKALVAGKMLTLQLPEGAKPGDTLELVVIDRTPKAVVAQLTEQRAGPAANEPYPHTTLSRAAQLIGNLLLPEGETPQPATLNRGAPILPQPPAQAADLAPMLAKAVSQSGLFYEAHQAQWIAGKLPLAQLMAEPQGLRSAPETLARHSAPPAAAEAASTAAAPPGSAGTTPPASLLQTLFGGEQPAAASSPATAQQQATALAQAVPEELRPLVQQQLDAVATQRLVWHGEAWPNLPMEWEIEREKPEQGNSAEGQEDNAWRTTLRLSMPRLGQLEASLHLTPAGVRVTVATPYGETAAGLREEAPALASALEAAGIHVLAFQVKHESGTE